MLNALQIFRKNGRLLARKSTLLLVLSALIVFAGSCSRKLPCPDTAKATKQAKTGKKKKAAPKKQATDGETEGDGTETAEASAALTDEESTTPAKPKISGTKNTYNKNGLLTKKKYKRLRNNPGRKRSRANGGILGIFSGKKKSGNKSKRSNTNVEPVVE